jgi:glycosyltransferase involved in cell wall biosynthesis
MWTRFENFDVICISSTDWDGYWGTQQQVMWRLAERNRILFVEVPVSPLSCFTGLRRGTFIRQIKRWFKGIRKLEKANLLIASPPLVLPFRYHKYTNVISQNILGSYVKSKVAGLGFKNPILFTFQADSGHLVSQVDAIAKIYYCTDDWSASERWWQPKEQVKLREIELIQSINLIFAVSQRLRERLRKFGKPTYFMPNAADYDLFSTTQMKKRDESIVGSRAPTIGFVGIITDHSFDPLLISWLAERHPEWSFLIVGQKMGKKTDLTQLGKMSNVSLVGYQPIDKLPEYLAGMDICLIPWRLTDWTKSAFSLKIFEYLAAGKPVVAAWTSEYEPFSDCVYLAKTYEDFELAIVRALKEDGPDLIRRRMVLAKENTWDKRVERLTNIVVNNLNA